MDFQSEKSFRKLRLWAFQLYYQILSILKHVGDVGDISSTPKGCNAIYVGDVRDHNKSSIYIGFDGMVEKPTVSAFQNFFQIENPLSIKEVMSQNVCVCSFPIFDIHSITALRCI